MVTTYHDKILLTAHDYQPVSSEIIEGRGRGGGGEGKICFFFNTHGENVFSFSSFDSLFSFWGYIVWKYLFDLIVHWAIFSTLPLAHPLPPPRSSFFLLE